MNREIPPILISCTWKDLNAAIGLLEIKSPDALAATKYCITYIGKGTKMGILQINACFQSCYFLVELINLITEKHFENVHA